MKIQHFMALVVLSLPTVPGARAAVLAGPLTNAANGHAYYLLSDTAWTTSEAEARGLGGHLVTINDAAENQWVLNTFFSLTGVPEAKLWIGLNDAANEGRFVWASGEPVTFTYWYPGEPDDVEGVLGTADYAAIRHSIFDPSDGKWIDISDQMSIPTPKTFGVVEVSPPPPPLPVAVTQPADQFMPGSARLNGQANPSGSPTLAWFEWGTSLAYGNATPPQSVGSGSNAVGFSDVLVGLVSGTDYHFRARASNAFGAVYGADQTFKMRQRAAVLAGPITNAASGHLYYLLSANTWTASEAEARGLGGHLVTINDAAENQWVLNTFFPLTGVPYSSLWIGLNDAANEGQFVWANGEPVTFTYWYPGVGGEDYAAIRHPSENWPTGSWKDLSDTSGLQNPTAPTFGVVELTVAVTLPADQFIPGSARLNGLANPSGSPTWVWFEWGTSLAYGNATPPQSVGSGSNFVTCSNVLVGLVSRTDYHFRTRASNAFGLFAGGDKTFNLNAQLPGVTTLAADQLTTTSVRLKGQVNPRDWATAAWFEWGTNSSYGNLIGMQDVGQGSSVSNIAVVLNGLMAGPDYHYRLVATNAYGPEYGADQTFNLGVVPTNIKWTGADPSGYWSAPANWFPNGVPTNGADLVFLGGLPPGEMVSTNDLADSIFRSIRFQAGGHTIRGNPITLTNRRDVIILSGTNVIACDLTFTGTPSTPNYQFPSIWGFPGELTVIGNVGGGSLYVSIQRLVIRGQFTGGSLRVQYGSLALYGDNPHAVSAEILGTSFSTLRVQGSQPNLNIAMLWEMESASSLSDLANDFSSKILIPAPAAHNKISFL